VSLVPHEPPPQYEPPTQKKHFWGPTLMLIGAGALIAAAAGITIGVLSSSSSSGSGSPTQNWTPGPPPTRQVLAPAIVPPKVDECSEQLTFAQDGNAGPINCSSGALNAIAWRYFASSKHSVMSLGPYTTPAQVEDALCSDGPPIPIETSAYQLAALYYGWNFTQDPSAILTNGGCQWNTTPTTTAPEATPATTTPPAVPATLPCGPAATGSGVEPTNITLGCASGVDQLNNISWTTWTATGGAGGTATESSDNCVPDCATGTDTSLPVNVQLSSPGFVNGAYVFQTITVTTLTGPTAGQSGSPVSDPGSAWGFG
jgi:hypothetical protein